jgi:hypothetical protein
MSPAPRLRVLPSGGRREILFLPQSALIVAHPGHELRVFRWMEQHQPLYCCLTDGSGGSGASRLASTSRVLELVGGRPGPLFGRYQDTAVYQLLLDASPTFTDLVVELADWLESNDVSQVLGDAAEGFNPAHDICRIVADGAVDLAARRMNRPIRNLDFIVDGQPDVCPEAIRAELVRIELDAAALERKIDAALGYREMHDEVEFALKRYGKQAFATEYLRPARTDLALARYEHEAPRYERYGETRVGQGRYTDVIRYRTHVAPIRQAIAEAIGP